MGIQRMALGYDGATSAGTSLAETGPALPVHQRCTFSPAADFDNVSPRSIHACRPSLRSAMSRTPCRAVQHMIALCNPRRGPALVHHEFYSEEMSGHGAGGATGI